MTESARNAIISTVPHEVHRISVPVPESIDNFRRRYEEAVPVFDAARFEKLVAVRADWSTILEATVENAPHNFIRYWGYDFSAMMNIAGASLRCVEYLMGNHSIAQRMYIHNPAVMLYAPLRTAISEDNEGATWFSIEQPSHHFSSFGDPAITAVGRELDNKVAQLLDYLDVPVPSALA
ncbi:DUF302 domain-containing protein [Streptomyces sp. NPDC005917]|uniref:DUF302 domain-containing protein n=1 Tax=unclassified Streptomyces TaxID=2593676 RepID=UPI0033F9A220